MNQSSLDALEFISVVSGKVLSPGTSVSNDGEVMLKFKDNNSCAVLSFDGDGHYSYALFVDGEYIPGNYDGEIRQDIPEDLKKYLSIE